MRNLVAVSVLLEEEGVLTVNGRKVSFMGDCRVLFADGSNFCIDFDAEGSRTYRLEPTIFCAMSICSTAAEDHKEGRLELLFESRAEAAFEVNSESGRGADEGKFQDLAGE